VEPHEIFVRPRGYCPLCKLLAAVHPLSVVKKYPQSKSFHTRAKRKGKKIFFLVNSIHGSAFFFSALLFPSKTFE
jgi:hypothetical protein